MCSTTVLKGVFLMVSSFSEFSKYNRRQTFVPPNTENSAGRFSDSPLSHSRAFPNRQLTDFIQPTSREAYNFLQVSGEESRQETAVLDLLRTFPQGYTDAEIAVLLALPRSTVSARRNGINKKHIAFLDEQSKAVFPLIVNFAGERRANPGPKSRTGLVWKLNQRGW